MANILFLILAGALLFILLIILLFSILKATSLSLNGAPYIQIPDEVLPHIISALNLKDNSVMYDLGCGNGKVLIVLSRETPKARFIGVDNAILPIFMARWNIKKNASVSNISIVKQNFFKTDLSQATHIFTYLYPKLMKSLLPKLERELKPGTKLISCDFQFENKKPVEIIDLHRPKGKLGKLLYVYEF